MDPVKNAYEKLTKVLVLLNDLGLGNSSAAEELIEVIDQLTAKWCRPDNRLGLAICRVCGNDNASYHADNWAS